MKKVPVWIGMLVTVMAVACLSGCTHSHQWKEATCTKPKTCVACGDTEGEALGHDWTEPTCTQSSRCSRCQKTNGKPLGHKWTEATCMKASVCTVCGASGKTLAEHSVAEWSVEEAATCANNGTEVGVCAVCGETIRRPIARLPHTAGDWVLTQKPTMTSDGEESKVCTACGVVISTRKYTPSAEEIEALYKTSCTPYTYDEIARDPDRYVNTEGVYTGEVVQVLESGNNLEMRVNITWGRYSYSDTIYVFYTKKAGESRILEDDIITIYGTNKGTISYESVMHTTITLPRVDAKYIEYPGDDWGV